MIFTTEVPVGQLGPTHPQPQLTRLVLLLLCRLTTVGEFMNCIEVYKSISAAEITTYYSRIILYSFSNLLFSKLCQHNPSRPTRLLKPSHFARITCSLTFDPQWSISTAHAQYCTIETTACNKLSSAIFSFLLHV